jgi:hypothetical protein
MSLGIVQIIGVITGSITTVTAAWLAMDYTGVRPIVKREFAQVQEQVDQVTKSILQLRFQTLMLKKQWGDVREWTFADQQELCALSRTLQYVGVPGC